MSSDPALPRDAAPGRPPPLVIGPLRVAPPVILAPMSSLTNQAMRRLCEEAGCGFTVTEFIAAPALVAGVPRELRKLRASPDQPCGVQIFGRDPRTIGRAAGIAASAGAALVDINMGCPAKKVTSGVAGCALMRDPPLAATLVAAAVEAVAGRAPVTVKIRSGWDAEHRNAPEFAGLMVAAGAAAVTVHGRTRAQGYSGTADLEIIARVKAAVDVPVIGNGDITDIESLERMFAVTGCDGAMIGRAAIGNPWIFTLTRAWWTGEPPPPAPTIADRLRMHRRHLALYLESTDERHAVLEMRKFAAHYLKGFPGAACFRRSIYGQENVDGVLEVLAELERSLCAPRSEGGAG